MLRIQSKTTAAALVLAAFAVIGLTVADTASAGGGRRDDVVVFSVRGGSGFVGGRIGLPTHGVVGPGVTFYRPHFPTPSFHRSARVYSTRPLTLHYRTRSHLLPHCGRRFAPRFHGRGYRRFHDRRPFRQGRRRHGFRRYRYSPHHYLKDRDRRHNRDWDDDRGHGRHRNRDRDHDRDWDHDRRGRRHDDDDRHGRHEDRDRHEGRRRHGGPRVHWRLR